MDKNGKYYIAIQKVFTLSQNYESYVPETDKDWREFETKIERHWLDGTQFERDLIMAFLQEKKREWEQKYGI